MSSFELTEIRFVELNITLKYCTYSSLLLGACFLAFCSGTQTTETTIEGLAVRSLAPPAQIVQLTLNNEPSSSALHGSSLPLVCTVCVCVGV